MSINNSTSWDDYEKQTESIMDEVKSGDGVSYQQEELNDSRGYEKKEAWSEEDFSLGANEENLSEQDDSYSEEAETDEIQEGEASDEAIEASDQGDEEEASSESTSEDELPSTEEIRVAGMKTTINYDMSDPKNRAKFKKAVELAGLARKMQGTVDSLRNELKETDLSFLNVDDPYSKDGMKRMGETVKAMANLQSLVDQGNLDELFERITGQSLSAYVAGEHQSKIDYENMTEEQRALHDKEQEIRKLQEQVAQRERAEEQRKAQIDSEAARVRYNEERNAVVAPFNKLRFTSEEAGDKETAREWNEFAWNRFGKFVSKYRKANGSLPDQATMEKEILSIKKRFGVKVKKNKAAVKTKEAKKKQSTAKKKAAKAVTQAPKKPIDDLSATGITAALKGFLGK